MSSSTEQLFVKYEKFILWCAWSVSEMFPWMKDDIFQEAYYLFWKSLLFCDKERLNREFLKKSVKLTLIKTFSNQIKKGFDLQRRGNPVDGYGLEEDIGDYEYDYVTTNNIENICLAYEILNTEQVSTLQKKVLYFLYACNMEASDVSNILKIPSQKVKSQKESAINLIRKYKEIKTSSNREVYGKNDFRVFEPCIPKDSRYDRIQRSKKRWLIKARRGSRGKELSRYFDTRKEAKDFYEHALMNHEIAFQ